jgi:hypothetical protein
MGVHGKEVRDLCDLIDGATMPASLLRKEKQGRRQTTRKTRHCQRDHVQKSYKSLRNVSEQATKVILTNLLRH